MVGSQLKIGVFGDSFADINPIERITSTNMSWMMWLEKLSNYTVSSFGKSGTSIWFSYKEFLKQKDEFDLIIFCYSDPDRWFNINNYNDCCFIYDEWKLKDNLYKNPDLLTSLVKIHPHLYDQQLNNFVYQHIFNEVNLTCKLENKNIINILIFEENFDQKLSLDISKNSGTVYTNLNNVAWQEMEVAKKSDEGKKLLLHNEILPNADFRFCHMNLYNNKKLASIILENMKNPKTYYNLYKEYEWSYDLEHLKNYFT